MAKSRKFVVSGPHRVGDAKPGEEITLDPEEPQTVRLLARGQIVTAPSRQQSAGATPTDDAPASEPEE